MSHENFASQAVLDPALASNPGLDPALQASYAPVAERTFEALRNSGETTELVIPEGAQPLNLPIQGAEPLATRKVRGGELAMLYSIDADGREYQVWGGIMPDGSINKSAIGITDNTFDGREGGEDSYLTLRADRPHAMHLQTGDQSDLKFLKFEFNKDGLQLSTRRGHGSARVLQKKTDTAQFPTYYFPGEADDASWNYTQKAEDVAKLRREAEAARGQDARPTIGRDTRLSEGVYEGKYGGEAIVIDYEKDPGPIDAAVAEVVRMASPNGKFDKGQVLDSVFSYVSSHMRYDAQAVDEIFDTALKGRDHQKISLGYYIQDGVGVCRHQALFAGVVLEKLKDFGYINGTASVDRNMIRRGADGKYDGHAWVRYTNSAGEVFILDVAQQKLGSLEDMMAEHRKDRSHTWDYARPDDKHRAAGHVAMRAVKAAQHHYQQSTYTNEQGVIDRVPWQNEQR